MSYKSLGRELKRVGDNLAANEQYSCSLQSWHRLTCQPSESLAQNRGFQQTAVPINKA